MDAMQRNSCRRCNTHNRGYAHSKTNAIDKVQSTRNTKHNELKNERTQRNERNSTAQFKTKHRLHSCDLAIAFLASASSIAFVDWVSWVNCVRFMHCLCDVRCIAYMCCLLRCISCINYTLCVAHTLHCVRCVTFVASVVETYNSLCRPTVSWLSELCKLRKICKVQSVKCSIAEIPQSTRLRNSAFRKH